MEVFLQFVSLNWYWFGLISLLVGTLVLHENHKAGPAVSTAEMTTLINQQGGKILDIRPEKEFKDGHILDSISMPFNKFSDRKAELEKHKNVPIIVVCKFGQQSGAIAKQLREADYKVSRLRGGISEWTNQQLPTV